jgi:membrane protease YdiL (CAAX protease family)
MLAILIAAVLFGRPFALLEGGWGFGETVVGILLVTVAGMVALGVSAVFLPTPDIDPEDKKIWTYGWETIFFVLCVWAPVWEEFIFRYCLVGAMYENHPLLAIGLSGVLFGIVHSHYKAAKIVKGLGYAWLYVMAGTIWAPIAAHALWNFGVMMIVKMKQRRRLRY